MNHVSTHTDKLRYPLFTEGSQSFCKSHFLFFKSLLKCDFFGLVREVIACNEPRKNDPPPVMP